MDTLWTLIAGFMYFEMAIVLFLFIPIASPKRYNSIFKSRFLQGLQQQAGTYFLILLAILFLLLLNAIREMIKYSKVVDSHKPYQHLNVKMQGSMILFRAQRNFYILGFSLFLCLVIRRLVTLISSQAALLDQFEASLKQARSASYAARVSSVMHERGEVAQNEAHDQEVTELKKKITELEEKLNYEVKDKGAMKKQAENLSQQYDSLAEEHSKLSKRITAGGDTESKKDE